MRVEWLCPTGMWALRRHSCWKHEGWGGLQQLVPVDIWHPTAPPPPPLSAISTGRTSVWDHFGVFWGLSHLRLKVWPQGTRRFRSGDDDFPSSNEFKTFLMKWFMIWKQKAWSPLSLSSLILMTTNTSEPENLLLLHQCSMSATWQLKGPEEAGTKRCCTLPRS